MAKERNYIATTLEGLEGLLQDELRELGAAGITPGKRMVWFKGDKSTLYTVCYASRLAMRVLEPLADFKIKKADDLYHKVMELPWRKIFGPDETFAITGVIHSDLFPHTNYPTLVMKDAICDRIRKESGRRPDVAREDPDIRLNLYIQDRTVNIALDAVGGSMHLRGYRRFGGHAPLNEVLAAAMLRFAGWTPDIPLLDPMCGSGTILIEAAEWAVGRPSQIRRGKFAFQRWPDFEPLTWRKVRQIRSENLPPPGLSLTGYDFDMTILEGARSNIRIANMGEIIHTEKVDFFKAKPNAHQGMIILNPPYDERLPLEEAEVYYKDIGDKLKNDFKGCTAWVLSGNKAALRQIGLKSAQRIPLLNGPLDVEFCRYDLF